MIRRLFTACLSRLSPAVGEKSLVFGVDAAVSWVAFMNHQHASGPGGLNLTKFGGNGGQTWAFQVLTEFIQPIQLVKSSISRRSLGMEMVYHCASRMIWGI